MKLAEPAPQRSLISLITNHPLFLLIAGAACVLGVIAGSGYLLNLAGVSRKFITEKLGAQFVTVFELSFIAIASLIGYVLFVKLVERRPMADFRLGGAFKELFVGLLIGAALITAVVGIMAVMGGYSVHGFGASDKQWAMVAMGIGPGITEEILMRGLLFRFVEKWLGSWVAIAISAFVFGIMHIFNDNATLFSSLAISLEAGILLAGIYMVTRRLWAVIGVHAAWNYVQGGVFNIPVSGNPVDGLIKGHTDGSELLTGGIFGAEASLPAIVMATAAGGYALWIAHKKGRFVAPSWHRIKFGEADPMRTPVVF